MYDIIVNVLIKSFSGLTVIRKLNNNYFNWTTTRTQRSFAGIFSRFITPQDFSALYAMHRVSILNDY